MIIFRVACWGGLCRLDQAVFYEAAGLAGVAFYLGSYAMLQAGLVKGNGYTYAVLNLVAATLVLMSLFNGWNLWSAIIQISWITISVVGMTRVWILTRGLRFTAEEDELRHRHFSHMRRLDAKRFFQAGAWHDGVPGDPLTTAGEPVTQLSYITDGGVDIIVGGHTIATAGSGEFIGEMACLSRGPASATVQINQPSRCFAISSDALHRLIRRNGEIEAHLEAAFSHNIRAKLVATNNRLQMSMQDKSAASAAAE